MRQLAITFQFIFCLSLPFAVSVWPFTFWADSQFNFIAFLAVPVAYILLTVLTCGGVSRFGTKAIHNGKLERSLDNLQYFKRRLHAGPWTFLFYFKPLYFLVLSISPLKWLAFRLFGYNGNLDFTVYPDTWLRDLPVLNIGKGAYLSNKSSIATNICLMDGRILVEGIHIGKKSCVGHNTLIGPGTKMGDQVELGASITSGIRVKFGNKVKVYELCGIQHGVTIEDGAILEAVSLIGLRCKIGKNIRIKEGSHIHTGTKIETQAEADKLYSDETGALTKKRNHALQKLTLIKKQTESIGEEVNENDDFTPKQ